MKIKLKHIIFWRERVLGLLINTHGHFHKLEAPGQGLLGKTGKHLVRLFRPLVAGSQIGAGGQGQFIGSRLCRSFLSEGRVRARLAEMKRAVLSSRTEV